jgi:hypothetical protein
MKQSKSKLSRASTVQSISTLFSEGVDDFDDDEGEMVNPGELVDVHPPKQNPWKGGWPRSSFLDGLTQQCHRKAKPSKLIWRCIGENCGFILVSQTIRRVARHAKVYPKLTPALCQYAALEAAKKAPSWRLIEVKATADNENVAGPVGKTRKLEMGVTSQVIGHFM